MKQTFEIEIPTKWEDVTLLSYLNLQKDLENYKDNEDVQLDLMIHHLCGVHLDAIRGMSLESYTKFKDGFYKLEKPESLPLQRFVTIGGVEYGFEPNLSKMAYGAYLDVSQYDGLTIDKNWAKIMNILYRPVTSKKGELYQIEPYQGKDDWEKWLTVRMDVHFGALFFFIVLWKDLLHATLNSLKEMEIPPSIKKTLVKSGKVIAQSLTSQEGILGKWMK